MKKFFVLLTLVALAGAFAGCEGPEGPAGADGLAGADGADGADGTNGTDGLPGIDGENAAETCSDCHNSGDMITGKVSQYNKSVHATGGTSTYGNREGECSECHTSQGFVYYVENGVVSPDHFDSPAQPDCRACHDIHNTYTTADWALRVTDPVVSYRDATHTFGDFGTANLCAQCHQARASVVPAVVVAATDSVDIEQRFGPHHAPQANFFDNSAGWQIAGDLAYTAHVHTNTTLNADVCVTCHMADGGHYPYGGHTFSMTASFHGPQFNETGCVAASCHATGVAKGKIATTKAEIDPLVTELGVLLADYVNPAGYVYTSVSGEVGSEVYVYPDEDDPLRVSATIAGAIYNYRMINSEEPGYAVHNPTLVKALLQNTIDELTP
jgi:hypothetical protein